MFQVLVKTTPHMQGSYPYTFEHREDRDAFVMRGDIWWYHLGEDDDWDWRKGGAWEIAAMQSGIPGDLSPMRAGTPAVPDIPKVPTIETSRTVQANPAEGNEEDDARW
jgi:hypothetical protein